MIKFTTWLGQWYCLQEMGVQTTVAISCMLLHVVLLGVLDVLPVVCVLTQLYNGIFSGVSLPVVSEF